ncbi:histone chaperone Rttp106-like-domain-containing protein [Flammula alnicola]|nr:histone chaperone Rttp106-like-domain-containing protein [Flammula alnicola]
MASETHYLRAIMPSLPTEIAQKIRSLCTTPANETMLENLVRLLSGGEHAPDASKGIQEQWSEKQASMKKVLATLVPISEKKRARDEDNLHGEESQQSKKPRLSPSTNTANGNSATPIGPGPPLFTLHSLSVTSPVRKKVDITIHKNAIMMTNPSSGGVEGNVPLLSIRRAFIVPTRGKSKPHWTVILLSSDIPEKGKPAPGASSENQQVMFGLDATSTTPFTTTTYNDGEPSAQVAPKGTETLPAVRQFLSHLNIPLIEPTTDVFKSACAGVGNNACPNGIPGVEAYRAAKGGNLWFSKEGILWGESKPCEFWPVEDLLGKSEGVRIVGSGRTCTVILTRRSIAPGEMQEDEEDMGEETEFGMVNAKEREGVNEWVRNHRHLFGKIGSSAAKEKVPLPVQTSGPLTIRTLMDVSDDEDEDFSANISDLDGSERSSNEGSSEENGGDGSDEEEGEGSEDGEGDLEEKDEDEVEELDPAKHPLLRPGAMPKMSRAALEMAVDIVENAFVGGRGRGEGELEDEDEEDELEDENL